MKVWILIFSAALFAGGTCLGVALQPRIAPPKAVEPAKTVEPPFSASHRSPDFSVNRFREELKLSDDQDLRFDEILSESQEEMQALGRAMRAAQDKTRERIVGILSPEQKTQLDSLMAAERKKRGEAETARQVAAWQKILSLNSEQAEKLRGLLSDARSHRHEYKPGVDWRAQRKESRERQNKELEKVLTPAQFKQYLDISELERFDR